MKKIIVGDHCGHTNMANNKREDNIVMQIFCSDIIEIGKTTFSGKFFKFRQITKYLLFTCIRFPH